MELNISNPIEAIYLNVFPLGQNIGFQIVATWVHLSTHPLIALTCPLSNCRKCSLQNPSIKVLYVHGQTYLFEISGKKKYIILFKKGKTKKEWFQLYLAGT